MHGTRKAEAWLSTRFASSSEPSSSSCSWPSQAIVPRYSATLCFITKQYPKYIAKSTAASQHSMSPGVFTPKKYASTRSDEE